MIGVRRTRWLLESGRLVVPILLAVVIAVLGALVYLELVALLIAITG